MRVGRTGNHRRFSDSEGVSPVVGTVLILVIMIIAIGGIMAWGVPAIQALQERAEFQAVLTQFLQMESDVRGLRDPQNTRVPHISIAEGKLTFDQGDRWVVIGAQDAAYDSLYLSGWEGSNPTQVEIEGYSINPATAEINVDVVVGGSFETVYTCDSSTPCGNTVELGTAQLDDDVVRIQILAGPVKAECWIFNVGHLKYVLSEESDQNRLHYAMGAVLVQHGDYYYLEQAPTVKDPDYEVTPTDTSLFVRVLQLSGTIPQGVAGQGKFPVVYHLVDNYGASRGRPSFDPATSVRIQIEGELEVPFCNYFDNRDGWENEDSAGDPAQCHEVADIGDVNLKFERGANDLIFDMSHSVVNTYLRTP